MTLGLFYLTYVLVDSFVMFPVSRNGLQEILQLRCRLRHFLWSGVDGTPKTGAHASASRSTWIHVDLLAEPH